MDTAGEHFKQGKDHYYNNEFEDAAIEFEHAIRLDRQNKDYFYWCGLAYYENEDYDEAIEKFKKAIELDNTNEDFYYQCGLAYYKNENYDNAIKNFEQSIEIYDNDDECLYWCGKAYYNREEYEYAIEKFEKAIKINDNDEKYFYWSGLAYYHNDNYEKAIKRFEKTLEFDKSNADYFYFCGMSYYFSEQYINAENRLLAGIELNPEDIYYYYKVMADLKIKTTDYATAHEYYELALENTENAEQKKQINQKLSELDYIIANEDISNNTETYYTSEVETIIDGIAYSENQNVNKNIGKDEYSWFGIDFGTTNSALVSVTGTGSHIKTLMYGDETGYPMPSLVAIKKNGTEEPKTGCDVKNNLAEYLNDDYYYFESIKSIINSNKEWIIADKVYTPIDIASVLFKALYEKVLAQGNQMNKAVVAIPIGFTSKEKESLRKAAYNAGFEITMFVSEPTAAFCCNYNQLRAKNNVAVFDWGGGTLDIAVLNVRNGRVSEIATGGIKLAGDDIDKKLAEQAHKSFCEKNNLNTLFDEVSDEMKFLLLAKSERAKCNFSDQDEVSIQLNNYLDSQLRFNISYEQFKDLIENEINKAVECLEKTIEKANLNLETLDCILCVGGSSNLRPLKDKLLKKYGNKLLIPESTGWNIAKGAAIIATKPGKFALSRPIGLVLSDDSFLPLLEEGQPIPCKGAPPITLALTEGNPNEDKNAKFVFADAEYEADRTFSEYKTVPVRAFDDEKITVSYYVDPNFTFKAKIETNKKLSKSLWVHDKLNVYYQIEDPGENV